MSMIECIECKKEISDTAKTCLHCGAKFENIREGNEEKYHCGWVNAKNRMGGYVGLTRFSHHRITDGYAEVKLFQVPLSTQQKLLAALA